MLLPGNSPLRNPHNLCTGCTLLCVRVPAIRFTAPVYINRASAPLPSRSGTPRPSFLIMISAGRSVRSNGTALTHHVALLDDLLLRPEPEFPRFGLFRLGTDSRLRDSPIDEQLGVLSLGAVDARNERTNMESVGVGDRSQVGARRRISERVDGPDGLGLLHDLIAGTVVNDLVHVIGHEDGDLVVFASDISPSCVYRIISVRLELGGGGYVQESNDLVTARSIET